MPIKSVEHCWLLVLWTALADRSGQRLHRGSTLLFRGHYFRLKKDLDKDYTRGPPADCQGEAGPICLQWHLLMSCMFSDSLSLLSSCSVIELHICVLVCLLLHNVSWIKLHRTPAPTYILFFALWTTFLSPLKKLETEDCKGWITSKKMYLCLSLVENREINFINFLSEVLVSQQCNGINDTSN